MNLLQQQDQHAPEADNQPTAPADESAAAATPAATPQIPAFEVPDHPLRRRTTLDDDPAMPDHSAQPQRDARSEQPDSYASPWMTPSGDQATGTNAASGDAKAFADVDPVMTMSGQRQQDMAAAAPQPNEPQPVAAPDQLSPNLHRHTPQPAPQAIALDDVALPDPEPAPENAFTAAPRAAAVADHESIPAAAAAPAAVAAPALDAAPTDADQQQQNQTDPTLAWPTNAQAGADPLGGVFDVAPDVSHALTSPQGWQNQPAVAASAPAAVPAAPTVAVAQQAMAAPQMDTAAATAASTPAIADAAPMADARAGMPAAAATAAVAMPVEHAAIAIDVQQDVDPEVKKHLPPPTGSSLPAAFTPPALAPDGDHARTPHLVNGQSHERGAGLHSVAAIAGVALAGLGVAAAQVDPLADVSGRLLAGAGLVAALLAGSAAIKLWRLGRDSQTVGTGTAWAVRSAMAAAAVAAAALVTRTGAPDSIPTEVLSTAEATQAGLTHAAANLALIAVPLTLAAAAALGLRRSLPADHQGRIVRSAAAGLGIAAVGMVAFVAAALSVFGGAA